MGIQGLLSASHLFPKDRQYDGVKVTKTMPEQSLEHLRGRAKQDGACTILVKACTLTGPNK